MTLAEDLKVTFFVLSSRRENLPQSGRTERMDFLGLASISNWGVAKETVGMYFPSHPC